MRIVEPIHENILVRQTPYRAEVTLVRRDGSDKKEYAVKRRFFTSVLKRRGNPRSQFGTRKSRPALRAALYFVPGLATRAHGTPLRGLMALRSASKTGRGNPVRVLVVVQVSSVSSQAQTRVGRSGRPAGGPTAREAKYVRVLVMKQEPQAMSPRPLVSRGVSSLQRETNKIFRLPSESWGPWPQKPHTQHEAPSPLRQ